MTSFGESNPAEQLFAKFGFTVENVVEQAKELIKYDYKNSFDMKVFRSFLLKIIINISTILFKKSDNDF